LPDTRSPPPPEEEGVGRTIGREIEEIKEDESR